MRKIILLMNENYFVFFELDKNGKGIFLNIDDFLLFTNANQDIYGLLESIKLTPPDACVSKILDELD